MINGILLAGLMAATFVAYQRICRHFTERGDGS